MKILICNDDGIYAKGIYSLAKSLQASHDVIVVAPNYERSASGHAITIRKILRINKISLDGLTCLAYSVDGTPADCVKMGVDAILEQKPDLILSGINHGANLGSDALYSGTVSAAMEGAIMGIKSYAVSLASYDTNAGFERCTERAKVLVDKLDRLELPYGTMLNINIPDADEIKNEVFTALGRREYTDRYIKRVDPFGGEYYWLSGEPVEEPRSDADCDIEWIKDRHITVVPLSFNFTDRAFLARLKGNHE